MLMKHLTLERLAISIWLNAVCGCLAGGSTATDSRSTDTAPIPSAYNVVWNSPSTERTGVMPLGNGDIAAGVCAIEDDALYLLLAKNDAFDAQGDLLKTGRVKIELSPNPFAKGKPFRQTLNLKTASIRIEASGVGLLIWADANKPLYHVQITSPSPIKVQVDVAPWKRLKEIQDVVVKRGNHIISYFAVGDNSIYPGELKYYGIEEMAAQYPDPYRFNTFGNLLASPQLELEDGKLSGVGKDFDIRIYAQGEQTKDTDVWLRKLEAAASRSLDVAQDWQAHCDWWSSFWSRSWIVVNDNTLSEQDKNQLDSEGYKYRREVKDGGALVSQSYNMFRFLMACQSRGRLQAKFNGGLFTQPQRIEPEKHQGRQVRIPKQGEWVVPQKLFLTHEDYRAWGRRFTFQNQRLLYWPLLMSGDADLQRPFFDFYWNVLPLRVAVNKAWFGHEGAYYRENIDPCGGERDCVSLGMEDYARPLKVPPGGNHGQGNHHSFYFTSGLETTAMMIERVKFTDDSKFRDKVLVPFAREILTFYDQHYARDAAGKLRLDPSQALETWWIAVNPAPDISGLLHCLDELLLMGAGTAADKADWKRLRAEVPEVPTRQIGGRTAIAPAAEFSGRHNAENAELYPVFPFNRFGVGRGSAEIVQWTMENRTEKDAFGGRCWTQDQIGWVYAGTAAEVKKGLVERFAFTSPSARFPIYACAWPDEIPDFDHFGSGSVALQRMLVQVVSPKNPGETAKILLLPAWPADWDVDFKLHVDHRATVRASVKNGKLLTWSISPQSRAKDVVVCDIQEHKE
ncbi:MAG: hypothetical protein RLY20_1404 [Verrucomicrobiota bacterium]|jgi:hypothetical protein